MSPAKLDAETLLSLPRPGEALASPSGEHYLLPYSHFDFASGRTTHNVSLGKTPRSSSSSSSESADFLENLRFAGAVWLDEDTVLFLRPRGAKTNEADVDVALSDKAFKKKLAKEEEGDDHQPGVEFWCKSVGGETYKVGEVPVEVGDLKAVQVSSTRAVLAFSAAVYPEEPTLEAVARLDKEYEEKNEGADVKVYDKLFARHWDAWVEAKKKLVFTVNLAKKGQPSGKVDDLDIHSVSSEDEEDSQGQNSWSMTSKPTSPLAGVPNIECPPGPFGDQNEYDITADHLAFAAKDPHLPRAWHTRMHIYLAPLRPRNEEDKKPKCLTSQGGARGFPVFSPQAKAGARKSSSGKSGKLAWIEMRKDGYEADRNRIMIYDIDADVKYGISENWDRSPTALAWGEDGKTLYAAAEDLGHKKLFVLDVADSPNGANAEAEPKVLTDAHTVASFVVLPTIVSKSAKVKEPAHSSNTQLLLTMNSFTSPNEAHLLTVGASSKDKPTLKKVSSVTAELTDKLGMDAGEEFWFAGADPEVQVHGFILKPHGYEKGKKYGMAFLVHGGPQGAWSSSWSTRWNPNAWGAQGYVTVAINPTGSTGYGQKFTDDINQEWGGTPYKDLVAGLDFVKSAYKDMIDPERMVMLGASYGGYMANWMQGHNDATGFKALVCHNGILNTSATWYSGDELYFPEHDLGGTPWEVPANYEKWSPHNHVRNWKTPELIIHSGRDYRLPYTEGLGVFNALQRKGIPSKFVYFPDENHWILNAFNGRKWHNEIFAWME